MTDGIKILAVDVSGLFSQFWEVDNGKGRDFDKPRQSTLGAVRRYREGHDRVAICCDSGKSFRSLLWESYKADRPDRGEAYRSQIRLTVEALESEGCSIFRAPEYRGRFAEADDVIGSLCSWAYEGGHEVTILSSDKDLMQLVGDSVSILRPLERDAKPYGPPEVAAKLGIPPQMVADWLALAGDKSDGYKPYEGIGDKRAIDLLKRYGSALAVFAEPIVLADLESVLGAKLAASLVAAGPEPARKALEVSTVVCDLVLGFEKLEKEPIVQRVEPENEPQQPQEPVQSIQHPVALAPIHRAIPPTAKSDPWALQPSGQTSLRAFAADVASSRMFPQIATVEQAIVVIAWGQNLGVPAMIALTQAYVVHGRVGWGAQFIAGLIKNNPTCEKFYVSETTDKHATVVYKRKGEPEGKYVFTIERAQKMGLIKSGGPWDKIPATMCRWGCIRESARMVWPDVVTGVYTPDEIAGELPEEMIATMVSRG